MTTIVLRPPMLITARLMPGVRIGNTWISLEALPKRTADGRIEYRYHFDGEISHTSRELCSGVGSAVNFPQAMSDLLCFLESAAESTAADEEQSFPKHVIEWAAAHSDDISMAREDIENP